LPQDGSVRFYFVSSGGLYTAEAIANELADGNHEYSPLFEEGHELITAIHELEGTENTAKD